MPQHHVFLIPGFFGFTNFGEFRYFAHVREELESFFAARGLDAQVHPVATPPTGSLRARARSLLQELERHAGDDGPIHLIGHSSGGLDARMLATPNVVLGSGGKAAPYARRVRSVVTIATPHRGTPSATFFSTLYGQKLLRLLSLWTIYVLRYGSVPLSVAVRIGGVATRLQTRLGASPSALDQLYAQLLTDFAPDRREEVRAFFAQVQSEQTLLQQLTPAAMDLFDATAPDRRGVRYGSVVCMSRRPGLRSALSMGRGPYAQAMHLVYQMCWRLASQMPEAHLPALSDAQRAAFHRDYGDLPVPAANDGMVPVASQVHGEIIAAVRADHLDIIGHFDDPQHDPPHYDWLVTGTGFRRPQLDRVWGQVAAFVADAADGDG